MRGKRMRGDKAVTVVAKTDGRGQVRPFGKYTKKQAGAMVKIGDKEYKVTKSGRVNIPKKVMEEFGIKGADGRNRINIKFATKRTLDGDHTMKVHTQIYRPLDEQRDRGHGTHPHFLPELESELLDCRGEDDDDEYSFS